MTGEARTRFLIVVLDALRPDFVTPELMPNLHAFAARGVRFLNSRSTFPTETRVNQSAVTTGCYPRSHGVVANRFPLPEAAPGAVLDTGQDEAFEAALKRLPGRLLQVPTLGEILARNGLRLATLSAGTSGGGRLINLHAERTGGFRLALRRPRAAVPKDVFREVVRRVGPPPDYEVPGLEWNSYAVDCYLDYIVPEVAPDVMLLWLSEPDESFHWHGIGSPEALDAVGHMDAAFGRILARSAAEIAAGELQVIAMSDHGQISLDGGKIDIVRCLRADGFHAGTEPVSGVDYTVAVHNAGGIWVQDSDPFLIRPLVEWLQDQDWCGPLFTRDALDGTLTHADVMVDHPRAADVVLALAHDERINRWGRAGLSGDNAPYPGHGGCHGGLSRFELNTFLAMGGTAFHDELDLATPAGNVDILPTLLDVMGIGIDHEIDGRVLSEALVRWHVDGAGDELILSGRGRARHRSWLSVSEFNGTRYLNRGWVE